MGTPEVRHCFLPRLICIDCKVNNYDNWLAIFISICVNILLYSLWHTHTHTQAHTQWVYLTYLSTVVSPHCLDSFRIFPQCNTTLAPLSRCLEEAGRLAYSSFGSKLPLFLQILLFSNSCGQPLGTISVLGFSVMRLFMTPIWKDHICSSSGWHSTAWEGPGQKLLEAVADCSSSARGELERGCGEQWGNAWMKH